MTPETPHPDDLLPWYVNGSLSATELADVESHIKDCKQCQQEITLLQAMQEVAGQEVDALPTEFAWQRLRRDIRQLPVDEKIRTKNFWPWAAATAAMLIIVVQTAIIVDLGQLESTYTLAGLQAQGAIAQVRFHPESTEEDIRAALLAVEAEIVAGPGASGIYRIRLADDKDDPVFEQKLRVLSRQSDLVQFIERD